MSKCNVSTFPSPWLLLSNSIEPNLSQTLYRPFCLADESIDDMVYPSSCLFLLLRKTKNAIMSRRDKKCEKNSPHARVKRRIP